MGRIEYIQHFWEYEAIQHIMSNTSGSDIRSAFYHNNQRGWIYMEAPYNEAIKSFLLMTPRVRKMGYAPPWYIRVESIDIADWRTILHKDDQQHLEVGSWVHIKCGLY